MEEDRQMTDLGPDEAEIARKTPKRRFIGRRAADAKAAAKAQEDGNSTIESSAVQGAAHAIPHAQRTITC